MKNIKKTIIYWHTKWNQKELRFLIIDKIDFKSGDTRNGQYLRTYPDMPLLYINV